MRHHEVLNITSRVEQHYVQCRVPVVFEAAQPFLAGPPIASGLRAELATDILGDRPDSPDWIPSLRKIPMRKRMESQLSPWAEPYVPTGEVEVIVAPIQVEYPASEEPATPDLNAVCLLYTSDAADE